VDHGLVDMAAVRGLMFNSSGNRRVPVASDSYVTTSFPCELSSRRQALFGGFFHIALRFTGDFLGLDWFDNGFSLWWHELGLGFGSCFGGFDLP
jgi:hypothetical protein